MACLLALLDSSLHQRNIDYYLKKVLALLLAYRGPKAFRVGLKIAELVEQYQEKYPILRDIYEQRPLNDHEDSDYLCSELMRRVAFEVQLGVATHLDPKAVQLVQ